MPELAEVELSRRAWALAEGQTITTVETHPDKRIFRDQEAEDFSSFLKGKVLKSSRTHGKRMFFTFEEELHLELHLGMSGRLFVCDAHYLAEKHDHFLLRTREQSLVYSDYRQFGRVVLHQAPSPWKDLPLDPRERGFSKGYLEKKLSKRSRSTLKAVLLDQSVFPGLGNWMVDEICWRLGAHPGSQLQRVELEELHREVKYVVKGALKYVADSNTSQGGKGFAAGGYVSKVPPKSWLFQHRWKKGGFCPQCQSELARDTIATRTTAWCPACQK